MGEDLKWLIGMLLAFSTAVGGLIARDRQVMKAIKDGDEKLHERINKAQTEYVRREDLNRHIQSIESNVRSMREEQRETNRRIDAVLSELARKELSR